MRIHSPVEKLLTAWVIGVIVSLVAAAGALFATNKLVYGPEGKVREYFHALQTGNGSYALGLLGARIPDGDPAMLDGDTLRRAASTLKDVQIDVIEKDPNGNKATVRASYTIDGKSEHTDFRLHQAGTHWGVFDRWDIESGELPTLKVKIAGVEAATVNNRKVAVDQGEASFPVFYPGVYTVAYDSAVYTTSKSVQQVLTADASSQADIALEPSEKALESVQTQVRSYVDKCAAQNTLYPSGCPFEYSFGGRVDGAVKWSVIEYPQPKVTAESDKMWKLSPAEGKVKISFEQLDLYTGTHKEITKEIPFTLKGVAEVDAKSVRVSF